MDGKKGVTDIAARVRHVLAEDPHAGDEIRRGRAAFLDEVERRNLLSRSRRAAIHRRHRWLPLGFAASIAVGAAALWFWMRAGSFQVGEAREGRIGDVIEAADGRMLPVSFSEGSTLVLHDGGRIRILSLEAGATHVLVEDGSVDASIVHRTTGRTRWEFDVGAYQVTVNGTKFRIEYESNTRALRVSTEEGQVTVTGGSLETPKTVSAGESLAPTGSPKKSPAVGETPETADRPPIADSTAPIADSTAPIADSSAPIADSSAPIADSSAPIAESAAPTAESSVPPNAPHLAKVTRDGGWQELIAAGRLRDGLRAAERADFDQVCQTATAKELLALAEAGRFFGPSKRAVAALGALRRRFPGLPDAGTAAFTLGRIALEKEGAYSQAANWFEIYLREQPNGPLMGDAFGRLMEARRRSGDSAGARTSAEQYLRRFPAGPYAAEARDILSK